MKYQIYFFPYVEEYLQNKDKAIKKATTFREEWPTHKDHKAKSSDKAVKKLNKG